MAAGALVLRSDVALEVGRIGKYLQPRQVSEQVIGGSFSSSIAPLEKLPSDITEFKSKFCIMYEKLVKCNTNRFSNFICTEAD